jgi:hypothetical protein
LKNYISCIALHVCRDWQCCIWLDMVVNMLGCIASYPAPATPLDTVTNLIAAAAAVTAAAHLRWDGSQVYGSDAAKSASLREGAGGRMKLTEKGLLPLGLGGFGDAGVNQNWWLVSVAGWQAHTLNCQLPLGAHLHHEMTTWRCPRECRHTV